MSIQSIEMGKSPEVEDSLLLPMVEAPAVVAPVIEKTATVYQIVMGQVDILNITPTTISATTLDTLDSRKEQIQLEYERLSKEIAQFVPSIANWYFKSKCSEFSNSLHAAGTFQALQVVLEGTIGNIEYAENCFSWFIPTNLSEILKAQKETLSQEVERIKKR